MPLASSPPVPPSCCGPVAVVALLVSACSNGFNPLPAVPNLVVGSCTYTNPFSHGEECREYLGTGWTTDDATSDCRAQGSTIVVGAACNYPATLGQCIMRHDQPHVYRIWMPGTEASRCGSARTGCEFFGSGVFGPSPVCASSGTVDAGIPSSGLPVFQQPTQTCRGPIAGEGPGHGPNGQVCTWSQIAASTEEGRHFEDYASCDMVRTQRPYHARPPADQMRSTPDVRLQDPTYTAELAWVTRQVESSACVCCHSTRSVPNGTSNWYIQAPGNWMDTLYNSGLALGAGWLDSSSFGSYPPAQNNGFVRGTLSGFPSTDPARMARFFQNELAARGLNQASFAGGRPFGGPIYDQMVYTPTDCTGPEGVTVDGTITWSGGEARYVFILEAGSANPTVPPNLDFPRGTLWRVDVPHTGTPVASGIHYGQLPAGTTQRLPATGAPAALVSGHRYYINVQQDVGIPITRCLFTYPR